MRPEYSIPYHYCLFKYLTVVIDFSDPRDCLLNSAVYGKNMWSRSKEIYLSLFHVLFYMVGY